MPRIGLIQFRAGTAALWASTNPVLELGEPGLETDTRKIKYGNGTSAWNALPYAAGGGEGGGSGMASLLEDSTPQLGGDLDPNGFTIGTATTADLAKLHAVTADAAELNHVGGVTSPIQAQLDAKQSTAQKNQANGYLGLDESGKASADILIDGATNKAFTAAEKTKLSGVASSATANASDALLRDRSTHTGSQPSSSISDFTEAAQDAVAALLAGASGVTLSYDDAANTLTITGGGSGGLDAEAVRDAIGVALIGAGLITVTVNDAADTITISTTATQNDTDANLKARANHTGTQAQSTVTNLTADLAAKAPLASPAFTGTPTGITKAHVGLGNVDNTADTAKPVSTAQQTALNLKAPLASPAFTGTPTGITKTHVGLGSVDNTADSAKSVLSATKLTTARTINGVSFDGTANITIPTATGVKKGTIMALGDSIANYVAPYDATSGRNVCSHLHSVVDYLFHGLILANNPLQVLGSAATGGFTIDQIIATHLPTVLAVKPEYCLTWTIIGNGGILTTGEMSATLFRQFETAILAPLMAAGITPILASFPPAGPSTSYPDATEAEIFRYNAWASRWAAANGVPFLDFYKGLVDPATGGFKSGYDIADGLHPSGLGVGSSMIQIVRDWALRLPNNSPNSLACHNATVTGQLANPLLTGTLSATVGLPTGWYIQYNGAGAVSKLAAAPSSRPGNRLGIVHGSGGSTQAFAPTFAVAAGEEFEISFAFDTNATGTWKLNVVDQTFSTTEATCDWPPGAGAVAGAVHSIRGKAHTGTTSIGAIFETVGPAGAELGIERFTMRNLSTMGI